MQDTLARLDALMNRLIDADQSGDEMQPLEIANELGAIRASLMSAPAVVPRSGGERHFRCDACGTIVHGTTAPRECPRCHKTVFHSADIVA
jgi:rubrerythrin